MPGEQAASQRGRRRTGLGVLHTPSRARGALNPLLPLRWACGGGAHRTPTEGVGRRDRRSTPFGKEPQQERHRRRCRICRRSPCGRGLLREVEDRVLPRLRLGWGYTRGVHGHARRLSQMVQGCQDKGRPGLQEPHAVPQGLGFASSVGWIRSRITTAVSSRLSSLPLSSVTLLAVEVLQDTAARMPDDLLLSNAFGGRSRYCGAWKELLPDGRKFSLPRIRK